MRVKTLNRDFIREMCNGYEIKTTFFEDFSIADAFGIDAIKDTYNTAFKEWKNDVKYITELNMVLNWKINFEHYPNGNMEYCKVYEELFYKLRDWCFENLKGDDLQYYIRTTD